MRMSDTICELATALAKAQGQIDDASKQSQNPHYKSKYADLAAVRAAIREPLAANDIAYVQAARTHDAEVQVETMLMHKSGEFIAETLAIPLAKRDAHGIGSAISYGRRYGLMAILGLAAEDDDGNEASKGRTYSPAVHDMRAPSDLIAEGYAQAENGPEALKAWWTSLSASDRKIVGQEALADLKEYAINPTKAAAQ